jgi:hypothetical protein
VASVPIISTSQQEWFQFAGTMGETYVISAVVGGAGADTEAVMHLYDTDGVTQLAENDEASLQGFATAGSLEWTCPATGSYPVLLRAHDELLATGQLQLTVAPATGGDPCQDIGGATLTQSAGVISFIGDGDYQADALCEWTITCGVGFSHVSLLFSRVETEEDYDEVAVYEGPLQSDAAELSRLSGHNIPPTTVETTGRTALIQFTSDEDVMDLGFEVSFDCIR